MKKRIAILSAAAILLASGCTVPDIADNPVPENTSSQTSDSGSTASDSSSEASGQAPQPSSVSRPLFRESSMYFDSAENDGAEDNFLTAASARETQTANQAGLKLSRSKEGESYEYELKDVKANAFVDYRSDSDISIIIDPAYMYNIPLPSLESVPAENYTFDINGRKFICDSLYVSAGSAIEQDGGEENTDCRTDGYCYAAVTMNITITVDADGVRTAGELTYMDKINSADDALDICLLGDDAFDEKSADAAETYRALLSIKDKLTADDVVGVNLIDLDFDGKPEVIVSRSVENETDTSWEQFYDVDIYYSNNSQLVYVDTLYNNDSGYIDKHGNILGLKTLENGEKAWYTMSRINKFDPENPHPADYLFTMKEGKLEFTELFSYTGDQWYDPEDPQEGTTPPHYFMNGKELEFGVVLDYDPYYDSNDENWAGAEPDHKYYTYGDYTAPFGTWEIYGWLRRDYCEDMTRTFLLFSDEFSRMDKSRHYVKLPVTDRMVSFNLANLTDAYYFGYYDPTIQNFYYEFLGGYAKPVIYLYPENTTDVSVRVDLDGELTCTYPDYRDGWNVTAYPDGTLIDKLTGKEYYCLYWEGESAAEWDMSRGAVVSGSDTAAFLEEKLAEIGLSARERNEFIIYWLPRMQDNRYNYITFHTDDYSAAVPLEVTPQPDSVLRVFMVYAAVPEYFETQPQHFGGFERNGFTLVEWGGGEAAVK